MVEKTESVLSFFLEMVMDEKRYKEIQRKLVAKLSQGEYAHVLSQYRDVDLAIRRAPRGLIYEYCDEIGVSYSEFGLWLVKSMEQQVQAK